MCIALRINSGTAALRQWFLPWRWLTFPFPRRFASVDGCHLYASATSPGFKLKQRIENQRQFPIKRNSGSHSFLGLRDMSWSAFFVCVPASALFLLGPECERFRCAVSEGARRFRRNDFCLFTHFIIRRPSGSARRCCTSSPTRARTPSAYACRAGLPRIFPRRWPVACSCRPTRALCWARSAAPPSSGGIPFPHCWRAAVRRHRVFGGSRAFCRRAVREV